MQIRETQKGDMGPLDPRREAAAAEIAAYLRFGGGFELSLGNTADVASSIIELLEGRGMVFPDAESPQQAA